MSQWRLEVERAHYEAERAERRYQTVEPLCSLPRYVTSKLEELYWWTSPPIPSAHNYKDFRKAIRPAS